MKGILQQILSILLIPVVLFSTTSFSVFKHECGDSLFSISFLENAENCGMDMNVSSDAVCTLITDSHKLLEFTDYSLSKDDTCCNGINSFVTGSTVNLDKITKIKKISISIFNAYALSFDNIFKVTKKSTDKFSYYSPPITVKNIAVLYQVFKI